MHPFVTFCDCSQGAAHRGLLTEGRRNDAISDILWTIKESMSVKGTQHGSWGEASWLQSTLINAKWLKFCGYYIHEFPTLNRLYLFLYKKRCPQWAAVLPTHLMFWKRQNSAPVQLTYASRASMHGIGLVETIIMVFRPWTVSSYSNIERQPPVSSCAPDALDTLKMAKVCTSSFGLSQQSHHAQYWVFRNYIYDFPTLNSFFLFLYKTAAPSEQLFSRRT